MQHFLPQICSKSTQDVLTKQRSLGIKHGDINKYNLPIQKGRAVRIDFETVQRRDEKEELDKRPIMDLCQLACFLSAHPIIFVPFSLVVFCSP